MVWFVASIDVAADLTYEAFSLIKEGHKRVSKMMWWIFITVNIVLNVVSWSMVTKWKKHNHGTSMHVHVSISVCPEVCKTWQANTASPVSLVSWPGVSERMWGADPVCHRGTFDSCSSAMMAPTPQSASFHLLNAQWPETTNSTNTWCQKPSSNQTNAHGPTAGHVGELLCGWNKVVMKHPDGILVSLLGLR